MGALGARRWGPGFIPLGAWHYRVEMAAAALSLIYILFYWRLVVVGDLDPWLTLFWIAWPDLAAFLHCPIESRQGSWPRGCVLLHNTTHTFLVWLPVFLVWSLWIGGVERPLLGWAGHIGADRALGYYLREAPR